MVKTLVGGVLYAYELPPHEDIKPMTIEEEKGTALKNSVGLNDIQRGLATSKPLTITPPQGYTLL